MVLGVVLATAAQAAPLKPSRASYPVTESVNQQAYHVLTAAGLTAAQLHAAHLAHVAHEQYLAGLAQAAARAAAIQRQQSVTSPSPAGKSPVTPAPSPQAAVTYSGGVLTAAEVGQLWLGAGGPSWAEPQAVQIAYCESGYNPDAYNPSGASGVWQILGQVTDFSESLTNPAVNAANAVDKFKASGDNFSAWVCQ